MYKSINNIYATVLLNETINILHESLPYTVSNRESGAFYGRYRCHFAVYFVYNVAFHVPIVKFSLLLAFYAIVRVIGA